MIHLEAVTVSIGYGDILSETAKHNAGLLDEWLIVTTDRDEETREVCRKFSLRTLLTDDHQREGEAFNKGRLIERGLQHLSATGWRLHLDADIVLPSAMHGLLRAADLDKRKIYGCDRIMVKSYEDWMRLKQSGWLTHDYHCRVAPPKGFEVGTRWVHHDMSFVPIGFFQLWAAEADQWRGARIRPYPSSHNSACRTDVQFSLLFDRKYRELLAEMYVVHLESQAAKNGANWCGRKTKRFGPCSPHRPPRPYG